MTGEALQRCYSYKPLSRFCSCGTQMHLQIRLTFNQAVSCQCSLGNCWGNLWSEKCEQTPACHLAPVSMVLSASKYKGIKYFTKKKTIKKPTTETTKEHGIVKCFLMKICKLLLCCYVLNMNSIHIYKSVLWRWHFPKGNVAKLSESSYLGVVHTTTAFWVP